MDNNFLKIDGTANKNVVLSNERLKNGKEKYNISVKAYNSQYTISYILPVRVEWFFREFENLINLISGVNKFKNNTNSNYRAGIYNSYSASDLEREIFRIFDNKNYAHYKKMYFHDKDYLINSDHTDKEKFYALLLFNGVKSLDGWQVALAKDVSDNFSSHMKKIVDKYYIGAFEPLFYMKSYANYLLSGAPMERDFIENRGVVNERLTNNFNHKAIDFILKYSLFMSDSNIDSTATLKDYDVMKSVKKKSTISRYIIASNIRALNTIYLEYPVVRDRLLEVNKDELNKICRKLPKGLKDEKLIVSEINKIVSGYTDSDAMNEVLKSYKTINDKFNGCMNIDDHKKLFNSFVNNISQKTTIKLVGDIAGSKSLDGSRENYEILYSVFFGDKVSSWSPIVSNRDIIVEMLTGRLDPLEIFTLLKQFRQKQDLSMSLKRWEKYCENIDEYKNYPLAWALNMLDV